VAEIAESTNLKGCPHTFVYIVYLLLLLLNFHHWIKETGKTTASYFYIANLFPNMAMHNRDTFVIEYIKSDWICTALF
jgi:hypothetical protein